MANYFCNSKYEDTIHCSYFPITSIKLEDLCTSVNKTVGKLSNDYIWHRDEFKICLSVFDEDKKDMPVHLTSTTCFGDNIEDEWFIVYLILQITSQYIDLVVQIEDNDGDFLLIEAADFLPSWANPDTTKNRVFIYKGKIHIITPEIFGLNSKVELQDAINLVIHKTDITQASTEIQEVVLKRISPYPQKIKESHHRALVTLPVHIAALLTLKPALISPIVTSFCNHDMFDAKCFKNMKFDQCVTTPILFTKYLYAMLKHSKLPQMSKLRNRTQNNKDIELGWKLACGYEVIVSKSSKDLFASSEYNNFIHKLTKIGYFRSNIEGSKDYNELLERARDYFSHIECPLSSYYSNNISEIMATEKFKNTKDSLISRSNTNETDIDSDDWLNINPEELNTFLNTHYGKKVVQGYTSSPSQITSELAQFLKKKSDFEGIEYEKEEQSDPNQIDFDSDLFMSSIEKMLNLVSGKDNEANDLESDFSDDEEAIDDNIEKELALKLKNLDTKNCNDDYIIRNLLQSIKEEGVSGPTSNMMKNIDANKMEYLDSDNE